MQVPQHRLATWSDAEPLYQLYQQAGSRPYLTVSALDYTTYIAQHRELIPKQELFIYHQGEDIIGSYRLTKKDFPLEHIMMLSRVVIADRHQNQGHGYRMLVTAIQYAREQGVVRLELMAEEDNPSAIAVYQKCGFVIEGRLKSYYFRPEKGEYVDELVMAIIF